MSAHLLFRHIYSQRVKFCQVPTRHFLLPLGAGPASSSQGPARAATRLSVWSSRIYEGRPMWNSAWTPCWSSTRQTLVEHSNSSHLKKGGSFSTDLLSRCFLSESFCKARYLLSLSPNSRGIALSSPLWVRGDVFYSPRCFFEHNYMYVCMFMYLCMCRHSCMSS